MWYVLSERMKPALHSKYQQYKEGLWDDFEDLLDDFFLYLKKGKEAENHYTSLRTIRNSEAFDKWLLSTWRFFLSAHIEEGIIIHTVDDVEIIEEEPLPDERKIEIVSRLYSVLMTSYEEVLMTLNQRNEVMALRLAHIKPDGMMLHEDNLKEYQIAISAFWNRLKQALDN